MRLITSVSSVFSTSNVVMSSVLVAAWSATSEAMASVRLAAVTSIASGFRHHRQDDVQRDVVVGVEGTYH